MLKKKEELKNPIRVKTFNYCDYSTRTLNGSIYPHVMNLLKYLSHEIKDGGLGYDIATERPPDDIRKLIIFCEKENKKEVVKNIKEWWGD